jgi:hypothetical protein
LGPYRLRRQPKSGGGGFKSVPGSQRGILPFPARAKPSPLALKQTEDLLRGLGGRGKLLQEFFAGEER